MGDWIGFSIIVAIFAFMFIVFAGEPDIVDGWRCKVLEIPMDKCPDALAGK